MSGYQGPYICSASNKRRAGNAAKSLEQYTIAVGGMENDISTNISDFLSDVIHFCIQNKINFEDCLDQAKTHIVSERSGRE